LEEIEKFIKEQTITDIEIELRDLKQILDAVGVGVAKAKDADIVSTEQLKWESIQSESKSQV
jgi:hypothetical protein